MVKTCVGTDFCRFGTQDSTSAGIEMERRFEHLFTPHKVKMASVGCPRNCAEATVKDIGLVGQEGGWQVVVGGAAGKSVRKADLLITVETTEAALEAAELFFQYCPSRPTTLSAPTTSSSEWASTKFGRIPFTPRNRREPVCSIASRGRRPRLTTRGSRGSRRSARRSSSRFFQSRACRHEVDTNRPVRKHPVAGRTSGARRRP